MRLLEHVKRGVNTLERRWKLRHSVRDSDVFLVAYPKSGTNWVGFFLASILAERETGEHDCFDLVSFRDWVPDINDRYGRTGDLSDFENLADPRVFTVHASYDATFPRVLYLVRDPRAVMASYYWHKKLSQPDFDLSISEFVERNEVSPCDWGEHVEGWLDQGGEDFLSVQYEELHEDPIRNFRRIARFVGLDPEDPIEKYVEQASFENMARAERNRDEKDVPFIRKGKKTSWKEELPTESVRLIESRYENLMRRLGYEPTL